MDMNRLISYALTTLVLFLVAKLSLYKITRFESVVLHLAVARERSVANVAARLPPLASP